MFGMGIDYSGLAFSLVFGAGFEGKGATDHIDSFRAANLGAWRTGWGLSKWQMWQVPGHGPFHGRSDFFEFNGFANKRMAVCVMPCGAHA